MEVPLRARVRGDRCRVRGCAQPAVGRSQLCTPHLKEKLASERKQRDEARAAGGGIWSAWAAKIPEVPDPEPDEASGDEPSGPRASPPVDPAQATLGTKPKAEAPPEPDRQHARQAPPPELDALRRSVRRHAEQSFGWLPVSGLFDRLERAAAALDPETERSILEGVEAAVAKGLLDPAHVVSSFGRAVREPLEGVARVAAGFADAAARDAGAAGGAPQDPTGRRDPSPALRAGLLGALVDATGRVRSAMRRAGVPSLLQRAGGAARDAMRLGIEAGRRAAHAAPDIVAAAADASRPSPLEELLAHLGVLGEEARTRRRKGLARTLLERTLLGPLLRVPPRLLALRSHGTEHLPLRGSAVVVANSAGSLLLTGAIVATTLRPAAHLRPVRVVIPRELLELPVAAQLLQRLGCMPADRDAVEALLARGGWLVAFAKGTDTTEAGTGCPWLFEAALAARAPVVPCGVRAIRGPVDWLPSPLRPWCRIALRNLPIGWSVRLGQPLTPPTEEDAEDLIVRAGRRAEELAYAGA
jgi:1-acyl-sn-glycerol-3-phosphate acyltransferase